MSYEVEQKFRVDDPAALARTLTARGVAWADPIVQVDRYFAHPCRDFAATDEALRVRRVGEANFVTYKGPKLDQTSKTRREIELPISPGEAGARAFETLLAALGFRAVCDVRKERRVGHLAWQDAEVEIALDQVEGVGSYVELELIAEEAGLDQARARIAALASELKLGDNERRSYLELLLAGREAR